MFIYSESTKKNLLELINEFIKAAGYKISIQKLAVFLYSSNEQYKNEIRKIIPYIIVTKRYLGIYLTKKYKT